MLDQLSKKKKKTKVNLAKYEFRQAYLWNLLVQGGGLTGLSMTIKALKHFLEITLL